MQPVAAGYKLILIYDLIRTPTGGLRLATKLNDQKLELVTLFSDWATNGATAAKDYPPFLICKLSSISPSRTSGSLSASLPLKNQEKATLSLLQECFHDTDVFSFYYAEISHRVVKYRGRHRYHEFSDDECSSSGRSDYSDGYDRLYGYGESMYDRPETKETVAFEKVVDFDSTDILMQAVEFDKNYIIQSDSSVGSFYGQQSRYTVSLKPSDPQASLTDFMQLRLSSSLPNFVNSTFT